MYFFFQNHTRHQPTIYPGSWKAHWKRVVVGARSLSAGLRILDTLIAGSCMVFHLPRNPLFDFGKCSYCFFFLRKGFERFSFNSVVSLQEFLEGLNLVMGQLKIENAQCNSSIILLL